MIQFLKEKDSQFHYLIEPSCDLPIKAKVMLNENLDAKVIFRFPEHTVKINLLCKDIKNSKWYVMQVIQEYQPAFLYLEDLISFFHLWSNILLLLMTLERINCRDEIYLQSLCKVFEIPYNKNCEEKLCELLLRQLETHEEFQNFRKETIK